MDTRNNEGPFDLYEQSEYDPLDDIHREQGFIDLFWTFPLPAIEDIAKLAEA